MRLLQYDSGGTNVRRLYWLNHVLANLSVINVLTGSHSSGRGNRTARHRLAPPAMLTDDSWATGKWQQKKDLPAPVVFCFFSTFQWPVHLVYKCCYCDHNAYFCVVEMIVMIVFFNPSTPHRSPFWFYCLFFWSNLENVVRSHFVLNGCELSLNLCISVTYVRACACVCASDCVVL